MAPWTDADDRKLLLSVISLAQVNPVWEDVGTHLGRTSESVRQRYMKLKKEAGDLSAGGTADGSAAPPAATPTPRKRKTKGKAKKFSTAEDDEDDEEATPLAKRSKTTKVKAEAEEDDN